MNTLRTWKRTLSRRMRDHGDSGQALAEIAIALPLLLLMLIGIWEFARAYQIQQVVVNAAREGAREVVLPTQTQGGVTTGTVANATTVVNNYLSSGSVSGATVAFTPDNDGAHSTGTAVTVSVSVPYTFALIGPIIELATGNSGGPGNITLRSNATMRHE